MALQPSSWKDPGFKHFVWGKLGSPPFTINKVEQTNCGKQAHHQRNSSTLYKSLISYFQHLISILTIFHICFNFLSNNFCTFSSLFSKNTYYLYTFSKKSQPWMDSPLSSPPISRQDTAPGVSAGSPSPPSPVEDVTEAWISCRFFGDNSWKGVE